ncbi:hypothetical protein Pmani_035725 [Petrolisthes manimaculis]|uniref:Uncharacterized protein n=1 Tax=Petrolisthes manimaculis TaxID=1843537 RepID=A0AAE1NMD2_9EUCA|nr:hypothetical protein Pmani_035725 [Petrolisthes manimaculis]
MILLLFLVVGVLASPSLAQFPCPDNALIAPCICTVDDPMTQLNMDCSAVTSDAELENAFQQEFPFHDFDSFTLLAKTSEPRIPITKLTKELFNSVTFTNFTISHTNLKTIAPDTFTLSLQRIHTIVITDSFLDTFPFDILVDTPHLKDLRLFRNQITHMSNLNSNSLEYLHVSYNRGLGYGDQVFWGVPNLKWLVLNDLDQVYVAADSFIYLQQLEYLDLSFNKLHTLYNKSLHFHPSATVQQIKLEGNEIDNVEVDAFKGLKPGVLLWMQHNRLVDLPEQVWKNTFEEVRGDPTSALFVFDDNELVCECNLAWLIVTNDYLDILARGSTCAGTNDFIHDLDQHFFECQCGLVTCPPDTY